MIYLMIVLAEFIWYGIAIILSFLNWIAVILLVYLPLQFLSLVCKLIGGIADGLYKLASKNG